MRTRQTKKLNFLTSAIRNALAEAIGRGQDGKVTEDDLVHLFNWANKTLISTGMLDLMMKRKVMIKMVRGQPIFEAVSEEPVIENQGVEQVAQA
jgi:hypothetical protein